MSSIINNSNLVYILPIAIGTLSALYYYKNYICNNGTCSLSSTTSSKGEKIVRVGKLIIYPIKSCQGIEVKSFKIDKYGIINDRRWMLHHDGRFMSQRTTPGMANIAVRFSEDGKNMIMSTEGMEDLVIAVHDSNRKVVDSEVWKNAVKTLDCGDEAAKWFDKVLNKEGIRLVQMPSDHMYHRNVSKVWTQKLMEQDGIVNPTDQDYDKYQQAFVDSSQIMILSQRSIDDVNTRVAETRRSKKEPPQKDMTYKRFRPNILLVGTDAFDEDAYDQVRVGGLVFSKVNRVARCKLTTVDNEHGVIDPYGDNEPLRTLQTYRKIDGASYLGTHFVHQQDQDGELFVGDRLDIIKSSTSWVVSDK